MERCLSHLALVISFSIILANLKINTVCSYNIIIMFLYVLHTKKITTKKNILKRYYISCRSNYTRTYLLSIYQLKIWNYC